MLPAGLDSLRACPRAQLYEFIHGHRHSLDKRGRTSGLKLELTPPKGATFDDLLWDGSAGVIALRVLLFF